MTTSSSTSSTEEEEYLILHTSNGDYEITQDDIPRILMDAVWALEPDDQPDIDDIDPNAEVSQWPGNVRLQILYFAQKCWFPGNDTESSYWNPNWLEQAKDVLDAHLGMLVGNPGPNYQTFRNGRRTAPERPPHRRRRTLGQHRLRLRTPPAPGNGTAPRRRPGVRDPGKS